MKSKYLSILLLIFGNCLAQEHEVYQNIELKNQDKTEITYLIKDYINGKVTADKVFAKFDIETYKSIDVYKEALSLGGSLYQITSDINILSIKREGSNYFVSTMFYWTNKQNDENKNTITVLAIIDFWVLKVDNQWKISNYINYQTKNWSSIQIGNFLYFYHPNHPFDVLKAENANIFYNKFCDFFTIPKSKLIRYYIANNCNDISQLFGYKYFISDSVNDGLCAFYDEENELISTSTSYGEMHLHEIIHAMNVHFPQAHYLLKTGLSCYINDASSRNQENIFHFNKFENYIKTNNLNFEKFEEFENIDEITSFQYVTGPLICNAIYRKGGKKLLLEYLNNTKTSDELKKKLIKDFKIKSFKEFFINEVKYYKAQGKSLLYI